MSLMAKFGRGFRNKAVDIKLINAIELATLDSFMSAPGFGGEWRFPTLDGPEAFVNDPMSWVGIDGVLHLSGNMVKEHNPDNEDPIDIQYGNELAVLKSEFWPALFGTNTIPDNGGLVTLIAQPNNGSLTYQTEPYGSRTIEPGGDGLIYATVEMEFLLASAVGS